MKTSAPEAIAAPNKKLPEPPQTATFFHYLTRRCSIANGRTKNSLDHLQKLFKAYFLRQFTHRSSTKMGRRIADRKPLIGHFFVRMGGSRHALDSSSGIGRNDKFQLRLLDKFSLTHFTNDRLSTGCSFKRMFLYLPYGNCIPRTRLLCHHRLQKWRALMPQHVLSAHIPRTSSRHLS